MRLATFVHKGLRQLYEDDSAKGISPDMAGKPRNRLAALQTAESIEQLERFPGWKLHRLKGNRKGFWSLSVTGNWRLVFRYEAKTNAASDIDLIEYH